MSDIAEPDEDAIPPAPRKTSGLAWACVFLIFAVLVVDILSTYTLGKNANNTFSKIGPGVDAPVQPVQHPIPKHK